MRAAELSEVRKRPTNDTHRVGVLGLGHRKLSKLLAGVLPLALLASACGEKPLVSQQEGGNPVHLIRQLGSAGGAGCGDGVWDPELEECDTGGATEACSTNCTVETMLASTEAGSAWRRLGTARSPVAANAFGAAVAFVQADPAEVLDATLGTRQTLPPQLGVTLFDVEGSRLGEVLLPGDFIATQLAAPSLAAIGQGRYVSASSVLGEDVDESGIALHLITIDESASISVSNPTLANEVQVFAQSDPTALWTGAELVVAWVDHSDGLTGPDIRYRRFDENLDPLGGEATLAGGLEVEGHVTLAALGGDWAAAYRVGIEPGVEVVRISAPTLGLEWETEPYVSPSSHDRPALINLDDDSLLLTYVEQTQAAADDIPLTGSLRVAVTTLSNTTESAGPLSPCVPTYPAGIFFDPEVSQGSPALSRTATQVTLAWQTEGLVGNPLAQELWQRAVTWPEVASDCSELTYADPQPLMGSLAEDAPARLAAQRQPAIFSSGGTTVAAWEDYGDTLGSAALPDVAVRVAPVELTCSLADPCGLGEGHCETDEQCEGALKCGYKNGGEFGKRPSLNACIACGNAITEIGEECDDGVQTPSCNANCTLPYCGDGIVGAGEQCDPGLEGVDSATCNFNCTDVSCGDGYVNVVAGEVCEPAVAGTNDAGCDWDCTPAQCGDGIVNTEAGEACELSDPNCTPDCSELILPEDCGGGGCPSLLSYTVGPGNDGEIHVHVQIDNSAGSGTLDLSQFEFRYWFYNTSTTPWELQVYYDAAFVVEGAMEIVLITPVTGADKYVRVPLESSLAPGELSPDLDFSFRHTNWETIWEPDDYSYLNVSSFTPNPNITLYYQGTLVWGQEPGGFSGATCGNSVTEGSEECDTGGASASCDADCTFPVCGDGDVNSAAGESCDPGDDPDCLPDCSGLQCTDPNTCLHVLYANYSDDNPSDEQLKVNAIVVNNGPTTINLNDLTLRYWFTHEAAAGGGVSAACDWYGGSGGCSSVLANKGIADVSPARTNANKRWDFGFQNAGTLAPGQSSGVMAVHLQNDWWTPMNDWNDYSYANVGSSPYVVTTTITAYLNGTLVWGQEPQ